VSQADPEAHKAGSAWFIADGVLRGVTSRNRDHIIRYVKRSRLRDEVEEMPGHAGFICAVIPPDDVFQYVGNAPCITINTTASRASDVNSVNYDKVSSDFRGVLYLIRTLGHRNVALVWGGLEAHEDSLTAYRRALDRAGIGFRDALVVNSRGGDEEAGAAAAHTLLDRGSAFTALFVDTDLKAIGAVEALRARGLRVPEDVSVIGSDDIPRVTASFGLTTIRKGFERMGAEALGLLEQRLAYRNRDVPSVTVQGEIIERNTCCASNGQTSFRDNLGQPGRPE
jgi:DNA-binding LacI/PurR family transcriptional regulator